MPRHREISPHSTTLLWVWFGHAKLVRPNDTSLSERVEISHGRIYSSLPQWQTDVLHRPPITRYARPPLRAGLHGVRLASYRSRTYRLQRRRDQNRRARTDRQTNPSVPIRALGTARCETAPDRGSCSPQRPARPPRGKSIRIDVDDIERKDVGLAWVDVVFWGRWIRTTFEVSVLTDNERVVMYEYNNHRYWDSTMTVNLVVPSRPSILETLPCVVSSSPKISPKSTTMALGHLWFVRGPVDERPLVSERMAVAAFVGIVVLARRDVRVGQLGAPYCSVGEKGGSMDGLLGWNGGSTGMGGNGG